MSITLALDPGKAYLGYTCLRETYVTHAGISRLPEALKHLKTGEVAAYHLSTIVKAGIAESDRVVVEEMRLNLARDSTLPKCVATANDLLVLTAIGAYIAGQMGAELVYAPIFPVSKQVTKARCEYVLSEAEKLLVHQSLGKAYEQKIGYNFWDSCAHGLRAVGRFGR